MVSVEELFSPKDDSMTAQGADELAEGAPEPEGASELDLLLRRYAQAMVRIGQLASQAEGFTRMVRELVDDPALSGSGPGATQGSTPSHLLARIESLEARLTTSHESAHTDDGGSEAGTIARTDRPNESRREDEIAQMRRHLASLSAKLSQTEEQLRVAQGTSRPRSGGRHRRPSRWKFWRSRQRT